MKILLVTEKCGPSENQRDGGARLIESLQKIFKDSLKVMQFGSQADPTATWHFTYPFNLPNRFDRRLANARFIVEKVKAVEQDFTHVIFSHASMQFGLIDISLREDLIVWTFPMFLTPSYRVSGEIVPASYFQAENQTLIRSKNILTPSHLEKQQLMELYSIPGEYIHVIPRGVNTQFLIHKTRIFIGNPIFCSIGSIKPQKNILGLISIFKNITETFPTSKLRIIGPIQDENYFLQVQNEIKNLRLADAIEFKGYVQPSKMAEVVSDAHIHISASKCETFGRSIFETLALGIPNVARQTNNAAAEILKDLPYVCFTDDSDETAQIIIEMLNNLETLSSMAKEIGDLYDDEILSRLLAAKIRDDGIIAISDFDGTLFHKDDPGRTQRCISAFMSYPKRIVCSARPISDLLAAFKNYNLAADWIVGYSGSVVTDGDGSPLWITSIEQQDIAMLEATLTSSRRIEFNGKVLQLSVPAETLSNITGFRFETYQGTTFIAPWKASKLRAVHQLLRHIDWSGQVMVFGDGPYDSELINYFDGTLITPFPSDYRQQKEIKYA
jgi:glycosyltransferase involved in cell wall biosynthesis